MPRLRARYEIGGAGFECPADLPDADAAEVERVALAAYESLGCSGFARVDIMLGESGPQILEINAFPGLTGNLPSSPRPPKPPASTARWSSESSTWPPGDPLPTIVVA